MYQLMYGMKQEKNEKSVEYKVFPLKVVNEEKSNHFDLLLTTENKKSQRAFNFL